MHSKLILSKILPRGVQKSKAMLRISVAQFSITEGKNAEQFHPSELKPTELTCREAINSAMSDEIERDENVFLMGEEVG